MKTSITSVFLVVSALLWVSDAPSKKMIRFDAPEGKTKFLYNHEAPVIALHNMRNANETFQGSGMALYARYQGRDGTSLGVYQRKVSDDNGQTWSEWTTRSFPAKENASKTKWHVGDKEIKGQWLTTYNLTSHGPFSISYSVQWSSEWGNYLEGRELYNGKHGRAQEDVVATTKSIMVWQSSAPRPPMTEDGWRCWQESGRWKLYHYRKENRSWTYYYDLPASRGN